MKPNVIVVLLVIAIVVLASVLMHVWNEKHGIGSASLSSATATGGLSHTEYLKSSLKVRPSSKYDGPVLYNKLTSSILATLLTKDRPKSANSSTTSWDQLHCEKWAIVSTINAPTTAVQKLAHVSAAEAKLVDGVHSGWCLLVVADTGSLETYELNIPNIKFTYLSVSRQKELANTASAAQKELYQALPWGHVGRKNAGYLYALRHGARYIYDFDDDVMLLSKQQTIHIPGVVVNPATKTATLTDLFTTRVPSAPYDAEVFNPFPLFGANHNPSWPRGFPPERILTNSSTHEAPIETATVKVPRESIGVVQYLANHDPDVDSMYRLVRPLPLDFPLHGVPPLILPGQRAAVPSEGGVDENASGRGGMGRGDVDRGSANRGNAERGGIARESRYLADAAPASVSASVAISDKNTTAEAKVDVPVSVAAPVGVAATAAAKLAASVAAAKATTANIPAPVARAAPTIDAATLSVSSAATATATAGATTTVDKGPNPLLDVAPYSHTVYAPYNSQSTLHTPRALFALLLPLTAHRRVSDIWRSYIAQRLFAEIGVRVAFHSPNCAHIRKSKDSDLPDMLSELPLYADSLSFVRILRAFVGTSTTLPGRMEELYVHLYEQGFIGLEDVNLVQKWIAALLESGYEFPSLVK